MNFKSVGQDPPSQEKQCSILQNKDINPDVFSVLNLLYCYSTITKVDRHLKTFSEHGHIFIYRYIVSSLLLRYNLSSSQLRNLEVKSLFASVLTDTMTKIYFYDKVGNKNILLVTHDFYNILRRCFVVYRSNKYISPTDSLIVNSKGVEINFPHHVAQRFMKRLGYEGKTSMKHICCDMTHIRAKSYLRVNSADSIKNLEIIQNTITSLITPMEDSEKPDNEEESFFTIFPVHINKKPPQTRDVRKRAFEFPSLWIAKWRYKQAIARISFVLETTCKYKKCLDKNDVLKETQKQNWHVSSHIIEKILKQRKSPVYRRQFKNISDHDTIIKCNTQEWPGLIVVDGLPLRGRGVKALCAFEKGELICDYHGSLLTDKEGKNLYSGMKQGEMGYLFSFKIDGKTFWIDGTQNDSSYGRLINHSKKHPNMVTKMKFICGKPILLMYAKKHIQPMEELLHNYNCQNDQESSDLLWLNQCICEECSPEMQHPII